MDKRIRFRWSKNKASRQTVNRKRRNVRIYSATSIRRLKASQVGIQKKNAYMISNINQLLRLYEANLLSDIEFEKRRSDLFDACGNRTIRLKKY